MARTVPFTSPDSTIQPVLPQAEEHGEIFDTKAGDPAGDPKGLAPLALTVNGLDEQKRHTIVSDYNPDAILVSLGRAAYYRGKVMGHRNLGNETADVWLWLTALDAGDNNPTGAQVDVTSTGGAGTVSWNFSGSDVPTITKVYLGTLNVVDDVSEWEDFEVTISSTGENSLVTVTVYGVSIIYKRAANAILAGEYVNGQVSQDLDAYAGERPVSTARDRDLAGNLVAMYQERVGQVQSAAMDDRGIFSSDSGSIFGGTVPEDVTVLRVHVRTNNPAANVAVTGTTSSLTIVTSGGGAVQTWYSGSLTVTPETAERVRVYQAPDSVITSICAWWADAAAPGAA